ncbi:MAG: hypothetical protein HYS59_00065 [Candidatus Vogelbacteria bacterium]|nr:hypothetical protein [Candidatus Vogelbacteria bacterium]
MADKPLEVLRELKSFEWQTKSGWLGYSSGIFLLSVFLIFSLQQIKVPLNLYWILGIFAVPQAIHSLLWWIKRNFFYDPAVLTVAFAIATEESSKEYYREIKKRFKEQLATHNLQSHLKFKELPSDVNFADAKTAEEFIIKKGIRLLIWGNTIEGNLNNEPFTQFNIKLSYQHRAFDKDKQKRFVDDIGVAIQRTMWGVSKPNSFYQLVVVSGNVVEISLFTLGACLATVPNLHYLLKSVDIFEKLDLMLKERKQDVNFPNLTFVRQKTRSFLGDSYNFLLMFYWNHVKDLDKAIAYADKAIKIDENNFIAHQNMAVFQWLKGDADRAKYHTKRAWHIRPGHPLPRFNKAFFFIQEKKFESGLKQYKKIEYVGDTNIVDVIEFVEKEFEKTNNNFGLLFVTGWLNMRYADQVRGVSQLQDFLLRSNGQQEYNPLIVEAQKVLAIEAQK